MGCDIHLIVERRDDAGVWHTLPVPHQTMEVLTQRCYDVFGVLAGVRRSGPVIAEPRGLPTDHSLTWMSEDELERALGDHSFSWLLPEEILTHHARSRWPASMESWVRAWAWRGWGDGRHRFVFGFDS